MPPPKELKVLPRWIGIGLLVILASPFIWFAINHLKIALFILGAVIVYFTVCYFSRRRQLAERANDSLCTFARSLPARSHDTWVVRATYEELHRFANIPLRPSDRLVRDVGLEDALDEEDVLCEIARRAGRSWDGQAENPYFGRVFTIADLIVFMEHQPKLPPVSPNLAS